MPAAATAPATDYVACRSSDTQLVIGDEGYDSFVNAFWRVTDVRSNILGTAVFPAVFILGNSCAGHASTSSMGRVCISTPGFLAVSPRLTRQFGMPLIRLDPLDN